MSFRWFFIVSTFLHGLALAWVAISFDKGSSQNPTVIVVELKSSPASASKLSKSVQASSVPHVKSSANGSSKKISLMGSSYLANSRVLDRESFSAESNGGNFNDNSNYEASADSFIADTDQWSYFQQVFERIDQQLLFDTILAQYNHFGYVYVEFEVGPDGRFIDKSIKVSAIDSILKVHALRALRKGLIEEFPAEKWNPLGKNMRFQAKFEFLSGDGNLNFKKQKEFGKPKLVFRRYSSEKPIPNNLKDHLLSGGLSYDAFAMAERWEKYNKKKRLKANQFDPFELYKADPDYNL